MITGITVPANNRSQRTVRYEVETLRGAHGAHKYTDTSSEQSRTSVTGILTELRERFVFGPGAEPG